MRWYNHLLLAGAPAALVSPAMLPVVALGATAPDWMEWVAKLAGRPVRHRGPTHWMALWIVLSLMAALLPGAAGSVLAGFAWGGLSHVLADALTVSGVPFSPASDRRFHLLGGRLRTGGAGEYGVAWAVVLVCWLIHGQISSPASGYLPVFPDWPGWYDAGIASAKEWRDHRFRFF